MDVFSKTAQAVKAIQKYHGQACPFIKWNDQKFSVLPGSFRRQKDLGPGGFSMRADVEFILVAADLPAQQPSGAPPAQFPKLKQTVLYNSGLPGEPDSVLRIDVMEPLAGGTVIKFECTHVAQGA